MTGTRDHGGDLGLAMARFGGVLADWIDLSTGINRQPYPLPELPARLWTDLPRRADQDALIRAAADLYGSRAGNILPLAGAQAAIQLYPGLDRPGKARVLGPTYNEHAGSLETQGWQVQEVGSLAELAGADLAVVVNPNNPGGQHHRPKDIRSMARHVGRLVVDESFADPVPDLSVAAWAGEAKMLVLRSFGKFWGLAGLRLGFVLGSADDVVRLAALAGPWSVSGPACGIGAVALADRGWQAATVARLTEEAAALDGLALQAGWQLVGGTHLFRTFDAGRAKAAQDRLARARIWSRIFPYSDRWLRLGLPGSQTEWARLQEAMRAR